MFLKLMLFQILFVYSVITFMQSYTIIIDKSGSTYLFMKFIIMLRMIELKAKRFHDCYYTV